ncbi:MAG: hypothetical protein QE271_11105 [Bacteriovoracaceae bacterium]|nr:hypothetical protein [Bacteriovoracaceae bacterium]
MANIKIKDINQLELWTPKELRKLRMVVRNRISYFEDGKTEKALADSHPLSKMELKECQELLKKIIKAEK